MQRAPWLLATTPAGAALAALSDLLYGGTVAAADYVASRIDLLATTVAQGYGKGAENDDAGAESVVMSKEMFDALQDLRRTEFWKYERLRDLALRVNALPPSQWPAVLGAAVPSLFSLTTSPAPTAAPGPSRAPPGSRA